MLKYIVFSVICYFVKNVQYGNYLYLVYNYRKCFVWILKKLQQYIYRLEVSKQMGREGDLRIVILRQFRLNFVLIIEIFV